VTWLAEPGYDDWVPPPVRFAISLTVLCCGCLAQKASFVCTDDAMCIRDGQHGTCEPAGACSFPDPACTTGRRFAAASGGLGGTCVARLRYRDEVLADQPLSYWRLGERAGTIAADERGTAPGTYSSAGVVLGQAGAIGDGDDAVRFSSPSSANVTIGPTYGFAGNAPFSVEGWLRPASFNHTAGNEVFSHFDHVNGYKVDVSAGVTLFRFGDGNNDQIAYATPLPMDVFSHVVVTYDGSMARVFLNGGEVASGASARAVGAIDAAAPFRLGAFSQGGSGYDGLLDEAAVYDRALPAPRIQAHFDARGS
jgi:signal peptidase